MVVGKVYKKVLCITIIKAIYIGLSVKYSENTGETKENELELRKKAFECVFKWMYRCSCRILLCIFRTVCNRCIVYTMVIIHLKRLTHPLKYDIYNISFSHSHSCSIFLSFFLLEILFYSFLRQKESHSNV